MTENLRGCSYYLLSSKPSDACRKVTGIPGRLLGEMIKQQPQMGVKASLNDVFIVKRLEPVPEVPDEVVIYAEGFYNKRLPEGERQRYRARIEKSLLRPLIRG